jgi:hypothetical protein
LKNITQPLIVHGNKEIVVAPINAFIIEEHLPNAAANRLWSKLALVEQEIDRRAIGEDSLFGWHRFKTEISHDDGAGRNSATEVAVRSPVSIDRLPGVPD